jgi:hypothetical protein
MRNARRSTGLCLVSSALVACSGASGSSSFGDPADGAPGGGNGASSAEGGAALPGADGGAAGSLGGKGGGALDATAPGSPDATVVVTTTIYAHTDTALYAMDPTTKAVRLIGSFTGLGGGTGDTSVTDLAVNAAGDLYVNSEAVIYKAALPPGGTGSVALSRVASISAQQGQKYLALGFTPADALGASTGELLIGGDGNGDVWSIDPASGAVRQLGGFGNDPSIPGNILALSGDVVFYIDGNHSPTGLATIRSCTPSATTGRPSCTGPSDYLAGIDMTALAKAYASGTPAKSLNAGIYGGSSTASGAGTGYRDVFGLGVWEGSVYGFTRGTTSKGGTASPPALIQIETSGSSAGRGTIIPQQVTFTNGWSGAGVTTKVTVTVPPPPPPPPPPK